MKRSEFLEYKRLFVEASRAVLAKGGSDALSEAAFPAYANPNPLASHLFWTRIRKVIELLETRAPLSAVLDFGCGGGVMLPFLGRAADRVAALDVDLSPLEQMRQLVQFPANLEVVNAGDQSLDDLTPESFDAITALDVLEHVEDLPGTLSTLCGLLKPGGLLVVSGPTENLLYRIGRRLSGKEYTGHYHVRNVYDIREVMARHTSVRTVATLFYPVPLFKIYCGTAPA